MWDRSGVKEQRTRLPSGRRRKPTGRLTAALFGGKQSGMAMRKMKFRLAKRPKTIDSGVAPIWLYDGVCVPCSGAVRYALRHETPSDVRFVALQSSEGQSLAQLHGLEPSNPSTVLFLEMGVCQGRRRTGAHPPPWRASSAPSCLPASFRIRSATWLYDRVALNRYRLSGRQPGCPIPSASARHRFSLPEEP
jgi:predicted DCC family thiol-disulfide oxidoreductase YuxK